MVRCKLKLQQKTMSLWSWVNRPSELSKFTNPLFEANNLVIWPSVAPQSLQLWEGKPGVPCKLFVISQGCPANCVSVHVVDIWRWGGGPDLRPLCNYSFLNWAWFSLSYQLSSHTYFSVSIWEINSDYLMSTALYIRYFP